jgi:hypothetical protein
MAAANTDLFRQGASNISTTLQTSISNIDTSLTPASVANIPTVTAVDISIDRVDSSGVATPSKWERCIGVVSGGNLVTVLRGQDGSSAVAHSTGAVIEMMPTGKWSQDLINGLLGSLNQDGSLKTSAVQTALSLGTGALNGWNPLSTTFDTVTYLGNRIYQCVKNSTDLTSTLSAGMRLRTTRTVAAPTQSTSLNGTTQYWSKTSPAGMSQTDDITVSVKFKLTQYGSQYGVFSRYDGTSGWIMFVESDGRITFRGYNGGGNYRGFSTNQSVPLNKKVTVTANLDMSTYTTATMKCMIDDVDVPITLGQSGTNPTALIQAGSLNVGAFNGTNFFPGTIYSAAYFGALISQSTMQNYSSQAWLGSETSLVSAYNFNGNGNDANTTNANNLTANNGATATNADSPFGTQASGLISSTLDYGIVQSATFSTNTTVIVRVAEGCTIPTTGGVASVAYSSNVSPYGFSDNMAQNIRRLVNIPVNSSLSTTSTSSTAFNSVTNYSFTVPSDCTSIKLTVSNINFSSGAANAAVFELWNGTIGVAANKLLQFNNASSNGGISPTALVPVTPGETISLNASWLTTGGTLGWNPGAGRFVPAITAECA